MKTASATRAACCGAALLILGSCSDRPAYDFHRPKLTAQEEESAGNLYLELVKNSVTDSLYWGPPFIQTEGENLPKAGRYRGSPRAYSLLTHPSFDNIRFTMEDVLARGVQGDFIEAGAWRGGATIFMRAVLKVHGVTDRKVFVADSFEGFPKPDPDLPIDSGFTHKGVEDMIAPFDQVRQAFDRYGLLDDQVVFLKGWFKDTLPVAPIQQLAVLRIDADMYEGTRDALVHLYPKLSPGGYVIIDDYGVLTPTRQAVDDYRRDHGVTTELSGAGWGAVFWRKP